MASPAVAKPCAFVAVRAVIASILIMPEGHASSAAEIGKGLHDSERIVLSAVSFTFNTFV